MSKSFTDELTVAKRDERMQKLRLFLSSGDAPWAPYAEEFEADMSFPTSAGLKDEAMAALAEGKPEDRLAANYAAAAARDAKYACAGRVYLLKQGHHNAFRELYEGTKIAEDNTNFWKAETGGA